MATVQLKYKDIYVGGSNSFPTANRDLIEVSDIESVPLEKLYGFIDEIRLFRQYDMVDQSDFHALNHPVFTAQTDMLRYLVIPKRKLSDIFLLVHVWVRYTHADGSAVYTRKGFEYCNNEGGIWQDLQLDILSKEESAYELKKDLQDFVRLESTSYRDEQVASLLNALTYEHHSGSLITVTSATDDLISSMCKERNVDNFIEQVFNYESCKLKTRSNAKLSKDMFAKYFD